MIPENQLKLLTDIDFMTRSKWYDIVLKIVISVVAYLICHPWFTRVVVNIDILVFKIPYLLSATFLFYYLKWCKKGEHCKMNSTIFCLTCVGIQVFVNF